MVGGWLDQMTMKVFPNFNNSMIEVQCCAWVCAVTNADHNYSVPSVLMHANGLMLLKQMIPEPGEVVCFFL